MSTPVIRALTADDWPQVRKIFADGIATGHATFQTDAPEWAAWDSSHLASCRLVAVDAYDATRVLGWAALSRVSGRPAYAGVAEVSVYVAEGTRGKGVGRLLLRSLISASEADGRWTLQASIFPENIASVTLHERCGFRMMGRRVRIAQHCGVWRDTVILERRSDVVGV